MDNFARYVILNGGKIYPLLIDSSLTNGTGLTNPSILIDNDNILVNLRHVEYTLYHAEKGIFCHPWGPLQYLHRDNDLRLITNNYLCKLNNQTLAVQEYSKIDTSLLDTPPVWEFVGLEDIRLVKWNNKLYGSGVRRDTTTNGQGRIELSEIILDNNQFKEISRFRIPAPGKNDSYCEKNWMPILDMPYHYVKWCNATEVVRADPENKTCETVFLGSYIYQTHDYRGGSQVIPWNRDYRLALTHQVDLFNNHNGRKNAKYRHNFILWDKNWNVITYGKPFSFLGAEIEFSCGMAIKDNKLFITFGFQDNSSFLLECPIQCVEDFINA